MAYLWALLFAEALFVAGVLGQLAAAALAGVQAEVLSFGYGPPLLRVRRVQIALFPLGGFVRLAGLHPTEAPVDSGDPRAFFNRPWLLRFLVLLGWPAGAQVFVALFVMGSELAVGTPDLGAPTVVAGVVRGGAADRAGIRQGDVIVSANGAPVVHGELTEVVRKTEGRPFALDILRGNARLQIELAADEIRGGGYRIGVQVVQQQAVRRPDVATALRDGAGEPFRAQAAIVDGLIAIAAGRVEAEVVGPVGILRTATLSQTAAHGAKTLALIGSYVVLWALFPIPPLPGGQVLLLLFGWRSRRRRSATSARDAGVLSPPRAPFPAALLAALLALAGAAVAGAVSMGTAAAIVLCAAVASGHPRAWAWGVYVPLLAIPSLPRLTDDPIWFAALAAAALLVPATLLLPPVRRWFQHGCPVCERLAARPVRSAPRMSCLACGSGWRAGARAS